MARKATLGEPLPPVFRLFELHRVRFRRAQLVMVAGQPNAGKSLLALQYALALKVPTLYVSADSDEEEQVERAAAMLTGQSVDQVRDTLRSDGGRAWLEDEMVEADHISWCWQANPTLGDIQEELAAYEEVHGAFPTLVILDNLLNVVQETESNYHFQQEVLLWLKGEARRMDSCVMVLHHCQEGHGLDPGKPPPRSAVMNKLSQTPQLILTVASTQMGEFGVGVVKNRGGPSDPRAELPLWLGIDWHCLRISEGGGYG